MILLFLAIDTIDFQLPLISAERSSSPRASGAPLEMVTSVEDLLHFHVPGLTIITLGKESALS